MKTQTRIRLTAPRSLRRARDPLAALVLCLALAAGCSGAAPPSGRDAERGAAAGAGSEGSPGTRGAVGEVPPNERVESPSSLGDAETDAYRSRPGAAARPPTSGEPGASSRADSLNHAGDHDPAIAGDRAASSGVSSPESELAAEARVPRGLDDVAPPPEPAGHRGPVWPRKYPRPARRLAEPPRDMFFQDYGVNPWVDAWDDNRSTFGLDVDTGSFTLARKYLAEGNLPPREAVRVEEFVNALEQGYAAPWRETFAIHLDGAPSPFGREGERLVRVGVQGRDVGDWRRKDAVLTFVIDVSGSMDIDGRLEGVKDALKGLVGALGPGDAIGIVAYTDEAWVALPTTPAGDPRPILAAIAELAPLSSTNVEAGLALGYDVAEAAFRADAINRVILCSDGVANVGATDPAAILERVGRSVGRGITLTTVGVGMGNYNDVIMEQLADQGDGAYAYVDGPAEAERLFREDLVGTLQLIARDAKVQVEFNPETVWAYRLIGYENRDIDDRDFTDDRVDAGEVGAGHGVTALYAVALPPGARGEIATVTLRYRDAAEGDVREQDAVLRTGDLAADFDRADPRFRLTVAVATFAEILGASRHVAGVRWDDLLAVAESAAGDLDDARSREALDLMTRASRLGLAYER